MARGNGIYKSVVRQVAESPPRLPKPVPVDEAKTLRQQLWTRVKAAARKPVAEVAEDLHRLMAVSVLGTVTLEEKVPVSKVHQRLLYHTVRLQAECVSQGLLPATVHLVSRWRTFIDLGNGRVIELRTPLMNAPQPVETLASIVVEETDEAPAFDWQDVQSRRLF